MLNNRGVLVLSLAVIAITVLVMGFSDKLKQNHALCDVTKIDRCAKTGGLSGN